MQAALPWAEKYRPTKLDDIVGNGPAIATLKKWALSWEEGIPEKRAVVLSGKAGVGKTSSALALAADLGWGVIELNASDARNEEVIRRVAGAGALNETFRDDGAFIKAASGGRKLIILDEADNVFGREDKGGVPAIIEMIRETKQPVVLIVNDYYALTRRASALKGLALEIRYQGIRSPSIEKALRSVAAAEGVDVAPEVLKKIAENAGGDLRASLNDLEGLAAGRKEIPASAAETLGGRDDRTSAYDMVSAVLYSFDMAGARKALRDLDEPPDFSILWIDENMPNAYRHPEDKERAFYYLGRADIMIGRAKRDRYFHLWSYASDLMSGGVTVAKSERASGFRPMFPSWLMLMSRSKAVRGRRTQAYGKLGAFFHTSRREVASSIAPYLPKLMESDFDLAVNVAAGAELDEEDLAEIMGRDSDAREIKTIHAEARRLLEAGASLGIAAESKRGARKGSLSLGEAVEAAQAAEKVNKPGRKKKEEEPAKEEAPPPPPPAKEDAPPPDAPPEPDPTKNRSLFEF